MALPAMISDYSKQQLNYGVAVGQSLMQLGQQVGQQLAMREYQKQATAALPAMQANYRQAFESINRGDYADGYMKMMETNMQFGADQNPFLANAAQQANEMFALASKQTQSESWRMQQAGGGGMGGGGEYSVPSAEDILMGGMPAMQQPMGDMRDQLDMEAVEGLPTDQEQPSEGFSFGGGRISGSSLFQPTPDIIEDAARNIGEYQSKDRGGKQEYIERITTEEPTDNAIPLNLPGYEGYSVVPITEQFKAEKEVTEKYTGKGREVGIKTKPVSTNKDKVDAFNAALQQAQSSGAFVQRSGQLSRIAGAVNGDWTRVKLDEEGPKDDRQYTAQIDNSKPIELTDEEYKNLAILSSFPATMNSFGVKFIAPKPTEAPAAEAAAGGMPAVQAAAPAKPVVPETEALRKQLTVFEEQEVKKTATERQNRIKQINKEIESLQKTTRVSSPSYAPAMGVPYSKIPQKKSAAEIKQAITKIEQLVAERDGLEGKTTARNLSPMDQQALDWANANPSDPRAQAIKQKLGL